MSAKAAVRSVVATVRIALLHTLRPTTVMNNKDSITSLNKLLLGASARYIYERFIVDGSAVHHSTIRGKARPTVKMVPVLTANLTFTASRQYLLLRPEIRRHGSNWCRRHNAVRHHHKRASLPPPPPPPPSPSYTVVKSRCIRVQMTPT